MAKKVKANKKTKKKKSNKKMGTITKLFLLLLCVPAFFVIAPTAIFCFIGLLPTIVTAFVEREDQYKWIAIGGMNLSGAFFFLFDLWFGPNTVQMAVGMLINPFTIVVMYGCASIGLAFYLFFPRVCRTVLQVAAIKRVAELQQQQKDLVKEWGREISVKAAEMEEKMGPSEDDPEIQALYYS